MVNWVKSFLWCVKSRIFAVCKMRCTWCIAKIPPQSVSINCKKCFAPTLSVIGALVQL